VYHAKIHSILRYIDFILLGTGGFFLGKTMAGCIQEKCYLDSYEAETAQVKQNYPDLSPHKRRVEVARRFRIRYAVDRASEKSDADPTDDIYESVSFTLENGHVFYPQYGEHGTFLDTLHQNQKEYSSSYSESDHQTSRLAEEAFRNGATTVVLSYAREGETNRDLIVMNYNPVTKEGKTFIMNTAVNGQEHSYAKILDIAKERFPDLTSLSPTTTSSILTDAVMDTKQAIQSIHSVSTSDVVYRNIQRVAGDSFVVAKYAAVHVAGDIHETWMDIRDFFNQKRKEPDRKEPKQVMEQSHAPTKKDIKTAVTILSEPKILTFREPIITISALYAINILSRIPEILVNEQDRTKYVQLENVLEHTFVATKEIPDELPKEKTQREVIMMISEKLKEVVADDAPLEESLQIPEKETAGIIELYRFFTGEKQDSNPEEQEIQKEEARVSRERFLKLTTPEEQKEYSTLERLALLYIALVMEHRNQTEPIHGDSVDTVDNPKQKMNEKKQKRDVPVFHLAEALTLLFLFSQSALFDRLFQTDTQTGSEKISTQPKEKTVLKQITETPWLLLSIIYYLAMIREQGITQVHPVKKKAKMKKRKSVVQLPNFQIVYAYEP
jgi:hypothetical protein